MLTRGGLTPAIVSRSVKMGLISIEGTSVLVRNPGFLRIGAELARHGVGAAEVLDELEALQANAGELSALAEEITRLVLRDALRQKASAFLAEQAARLGEASVQPPA